MFSNRHLFEDVDTHPVESYPEWVKDPADYRAYVREQLVKPQGERWIPPEERTLANSIYGSRMGDTAFVVGAGPSIHKAESQLKEVPPGSLVIAINAAITRVPANYWMFIDAESFFKFREHENATKAAPLGVDRFWKLYPPEVLIWQRAYEPSDFREGRLIHRATSLLPALHMAVWLGAKRIVTVGCDNRLDPEVHNTPERQEVYKFLFQRINRSLVLDLGYWLPSWVTIADASDGELMLPKTKLGLEIKKLNAHKVTLET